jgi:hypothetical protein
MKNTADIQAVAAREAPGYSKQFLAEFNLYLEKQPPIIHVLHLILKGLAMLCFVLPVVFGVIALYYTYLWVTTGSFSSLGDASYLPLAWVNFGLSMSFIVFPWGLDAMLLRAYPTGAFLHLVYGRVTKPVRFSTGIGAFFAGLGVMCAGAPGAARMIQLISEALRPLP